MLELLLALSLAFSFVLFAAGIVWMPFGGYLFAYLAARKGASPLRYGVVGALLAMTSIMLWLYALLRTLGVQPRPVFVVLAYVLLYALAMVTFLFVTLGTAIGYLIIPSSPEIPDITGAVGLILVGIVFVGMTITSIMLVYSLFKPSHHTSSQPVYVPRLIHIMPFAHLALLMLVFLSLIVVTATSL